MPSDHRASPRLATVILLALIVLAGCRTPTVTAPTATIPPTATTAPQATATPTALILPSLTPTGPVSPLPTPTGPVSPLPTPTGPVSPLPTPTSAAQGNGADVPASFRLAILHSNDTFGYTRPCG